ncbi:MAG: glutamine-hydrolyzing carbamoyl-phosphate synthase small subunit [Calditerrivibrio sp.]|nr:glutamine-hydrolyzing carbamoyl-phosphate synthase small subunit [Calditerrivibrio sp.]MCA1932591.1 glutamine-hydrolyzing carbamoyl-phosphate synthase small subunit [Calditerrivibrio sp.]MCA1980008.1 glutamine-hydrolyzing carbamoyl-phosphate synthase small subunit [Calditerrivibrio sp.]
MSKAFLVFEDGLVLEGISFGAEGESAGEVVFNTSITGYQEILTDPSYYGQMVTMTYPLIGNYGVNEEDFESIKPYVSAFIVKEYSPIYSNYRATGSLGDFLKRYGIIGIEGVDTRQIVRHIRDAGSMNAIISTVDNDLESLKKKARAVPSIVGKDLVQYVTCREPYEWLEGSWQLDGSFYKPEKFSKHIVALDFGIKRNILRYLVDEGCRVTVVPANTTFSEIEKLNPDGVFISNGPGDPAPLDYAIETVRKVIEKYPVFGICLGNQLLALASGGLTYKLKFGHHGGNQPVKDLTTGRVEITAQNHCFAVDVESILDNYEITHINLNDNTVEGIRHKTKPVFAVQYHPENGPGPHDAKYLFKRFVEML